MLGLLSRLRAKTDSPALPTQDASASNADGAADPLAAKLLQIYGPQYPAPSAPDKTKWDYALSLIRDGDTDALHRYRMATRNLLYYNNRQWIDWVAGRRVYEDLPNADNDFRVTMNYIAPILRARTSRLLPTTVGWYGIPDSNSFESRDKVNVAVNLVKARYRMLDMDHKLRSALPLSDCAGMVALKSFWNPNIGPLTPATMMFPQATPDQQGNFQVTYVQAYVDQSGQPVENEADAYHYRPGDTDTCARTVFNIRLNPEAQGWSEAEGLRWLIDTDVVPLSTAKSKFPELAEQIQPLQENESFLTFERMVQGSAVPRTNGFVTASSGASRGLQNKDLCAIREYWELPNACFKNGRLMVLVGGAVAYDGEFPQGIFPYAAIFSGVAALSGHGRALVSDLISPQDVINREWSAIVREMGNTSGGQYVSWDLPGVANSITNAERSVIKIPYSAFMANRSIGDVFQRLSPAQVPNDRWRMIQEAKTAMFDIGAFHEISRGQIPPGLDSGIAVQQLQDAESDQFKEPVEAIRRCLKLWAYHQLSLAKWGYHDHEERALPVDRPDLGVMIESLTGAQLPDPDTITIDIENFKPESEAAMKADIKELMVNQMIDPRDGLRAMDMGRGLDGLYDSATRDYARARGENLDLEKGLFLALPQGVQVDPQSGVAQELPPLILHNDLSPFLLPQDDDHLIHIRVHYEVLKDDTIPWETRQVVLAHVEEHRQAAFGQQLQEAARTGQGAAVADAHAGQAGSAGSQNSKSSSSNNSNKGAKK